MNRNMLRRFHRAGNFELAEPRFVIGLAMLGNLEGKRQRRRESEQRTRKRMIGFYIIIII